MNDAKQEITMPRPTVEVVKASLGRRRRAETRFRMYGYVSIVAGLAFLVILFGSILLNAYPAFQQAYIGLDIYFDPHEINPENKQGPDAYAGGNYDALIKSSLSRLFPEVKDRQGKRALNALLSSSASFQLREKVMANPELLGKTEKMWLLADDDVDMFAKGYVDRNIKESERQLKDSQIAWLDQLNAEERLKKSINTTFFTEGDSREPESAGIWGAVAGSFFTLIVTLALSLPIGMAAAIYLEEFAPQNRWTDLI